MAMTYLTKLKPEPMGAHSLSTVYGVNSLVMSGDGAAAYISVKDVPAGTPLTNAEYWKKHTDLTAVKQSADAAAQRANAARDEMLEIARNLTDMVEKNGNPVQAELVGGLPFDRVETLLAPIQAGSGDPSPNNIRPISGWTGAKLTRCGKNLLDYNQWKQSTVANGTAVFENNGVTLTATGDDCFTQYDGDNIKIYIAEGETITLSWQESENKLGSIYIFPNGGMSGIVGVSNATSKNITYTAGAGVSYITFRFGVSNKGDTISYKNIMIEYGSTATAYEPYQGNTYTADFGQTVYGGTLDWQTGVLTVDKAIKALTGTESVVINNSQYFNAPRFEIEMVVPGIITTQAENLNMICTHYKVAANPVNANDVNHSICGWMAGSKVYLRDDAYSTVNDYKAYLAAQHAAGTPVQIAYKLATPTTIQLTPQEIKQLQGVNTLYGDGSISMTGRADKALALEARIAALEAAG